MLVWVSGTSPVVVGPENGAADERKVVGCRVEDAHLLNTVEAFGFNPVGLYCKATVRRVHREISSMEQTYTMVVL